MAEARARRPAIVGDYELRDALGEGGSASVHLARKRGGVGFAPVVAVKRLAAHLASDADARRALLDEARLSAHVRHPNVVQTLDVIEEDGEVFLVLELVVGVSLARLVRAARARGLRTPVPIAVAIIAGTLHGLAAAHDATNGAEPLGLIHRDVSPQNILVDEHGMAKLADFGIAKARGRLMSTAADVLKGKLSYMAPEYLRGDAIDARLDLHAAGVVLWEALTGKAAFEGDDDVVVRKILSVDLPAPSTVADVPVALDEVVRKSVTANASERFANARAMIVALESAATPATTLEVAAFVEQVAGDELREVRAAVATIVREATRVDSVPRGESEREHERSRASARVPAAVPVGVEPARAAGRERVARIALAIVGFAVAIAAWLGFTWSAAPGSLPSSATTSATAGPATAAPASAAASSATPRLTAEPSSVASDDPVAPPASAARRAAHPPHSRSARPGCDPPWTLDGGIKHYKDECL